MSAASTYAVEQACLGTQTFCMMERPLLWRLFTFSSTFSGSREVNCSNSDSHVHSLYRCSSQTGNVFPLGNSDWILGFYLFEGNKFIHIPSTIPCLPGLGHWQPLKAKRQWVHPGQILLGLLAETDSKVDCVFQKWRADGLLNFFPKESKGYPEVRSVGQSMVQITPVLWVWTLYGSFT